MTMNPKAQRNERIIKDAQSGLTTTELQDKYTLSKDTIYRIAGHVLRAQPKTPRPERHAQRNQAIIEDARAGMTPREIQDKYTLSEASIRRIAGGNLRPQPKRPRIRLTKEELDARNQLILKDAHAGLTTREMAEKYDLLQDSIRRIAGDILKARAQKRKAQRNQSIIEDAHAGLNRNELMEKHNLAHSTIHRIAGDIIKTQSQHRTTQRKTQLEPSNEAIREGARAGMTTKELGEKYNLTPSTINRIAGDILRAKARKQLIREDAHAGLTRKELETKYGLSGARISAIAGHILQDQREVRKQLIREDAQSGMTKTELASKYRLSTFSIDHILQHTNPQANRP